MGEPITSGSCSLQSSMFEIVKLEYRFVVHIWKNIIRLAASLHCFLRPNVRGPVPLQRNQGVLLLKIVGHIHVLSGCAAPGIQPNLKHR
jgi:hypothetical protein